jgi:hypothetical protein
MGARAASRKLDDSTPGTRSMRLPACLSYGIIRNVFCESLEGITKGLAVEATVDTIAPHAADSGPRCESTNCGRSRAEGCDATSGPDRNDLVFGLFSRCRTTEPIELGSQRAVREHANPTHAAGNESPAEQHGFLPIAAAEVGLFSGPCDECGTVRQMAEVQAGGKQQRGTRDNRKHLSFKESLKYAAVRIAVTRSDRGDRVVNFDGLLGPLAGEGLANTYYPEGSRGVSSTFIRYGSDLGWKFGGHLLRQYWPNINRRLRLVPDTQPTANPSQP